MQLEQAQPVFCTHQAFGQRRRTGVVAQPLAPIEAPHLVEIVLECRGERFPAPQAGDPVAVFLAATSPRRPQPVQASASVGVDVPVRAILGVEMRQDLAQHEVLEDIGVVADVVGVAVTQHGPAASGAADTG